MNSTIPKIDIRPDHWEIVRDILHKHVPDYDVWAFGSRAKWTAKQYSDLDLAVITDKPLSLEVSANLSDDFSESDLPWKVDIVDWATTQDNFREIIKRDKVVVQKAKGWGMSADWPIVQLKDVTTILGDGLHGTPKYDDNGDYFFINGNNLCKGKIVISETTKRTNHEEYIKHRKNINDRTILVSINGTLGNVAFYNNEKVILGKSACYFNVKDDVNKHFVRYIIESKIFQDYIHSLATGSTIKNVSLKLMREFSFRLPPRTIQDDIAKILKSLDDKIHLNTQTNQTLEQIAQAIFKSWFVDFDPVKAKIAALEAGGTQEASELAAMCVISGKNEVQLAQLKIQDSDAYQQLAQTAALFPAAMQESELGEIPEGWEVQCLDELSSLITKGSTPTKTDLVSATDDPTIQLIKVKDILVTKEIDFSKLELIPNSIHLSSLKRSILRVNDLLFSIAGTIGRVSAVEKELDNSNCNQAIGIIRLNNTNLYWNLVWLSLNSERVQNDIQSKVVQGVQANASLQNLKDIKIVVASKGVMDLYNASVQSLITKIRESQRESRLLIQLRDSLLPKLLSGEIDLVSDQEGKND